MSVPLYSPSQGALEGEVDASGSEAVEFRQEEPPSGERSQLRLQRGKPGSNEVGVDEVDDAGFTGKELAREGDFAGAAGPRNDQSNRHVPRTARHDRHNPGPRKIRAPKEARTFGKLVAGAGFEPATFRL